MAGLQVAATPGEVGGNAAQGDGNARRLAPSAEGAMTLCGVWIEGESREMCKLQLGHHGPHGRQSSDSAMIDACREMADAVQGRALALNMYDQAAVMMANARAHLIECDGRVSSARALVASLLPADAGAESLTPSARSRILGDG